MTPSHMHLGSRNVTEHAAHRAPQRFRRICPAGPSTLCSRCAAWATSTGCSWPTQTPRVTRCTSAGARCRRSTPRRRSRAHGAATRHRTLAGRCCTRCTAAPLLPCSAAPLLPLLFCSAAPLLRCSAIGAPLTLALALTLTRALTLDLTLTRTRTRTRTLTRTLTLIRAGSRACPRCSSCGRAAGGLSSSSCGPMC